MSTTRFLATNLFENATLKNGTGGGAPALDEVSGYPMSNALTRGRYTVWQEAAGSSLDFDIDLGANRSFSVFGFQNHRPTTSAGLGMTTIDLSYVPAASGYPPGAWTTIGTLSGLGGARDYLTSFGAVSGRYVRISITCFDAFTLGRFWLGVTDYDLGVIYMPGRQRTRQQAVVDQRAPGGILYRSWTGDDYEALTLPFDEATSAILADVRELAALRQSLIYWDHLDGVQEVLVRDGAVSDSHERPGDVAYDTSLELVTLA